MSQSAIEARPGIVTRWLSGAHPLLFTLYAIVASFSAYFCMYAFRKPFSASTYATYPGLTFFNTTVALKFALITSQLLGYTFSKFVGIKVCSEINRRRRALALIGLIVIAELMLLLFAVVPPQLMVVAIFLNGIPLGMIWGLVVAYLEGRRTSEALLAGLSCSFILSGAIVKDIGKNLMAGADRISLFTVDLWRDTQIHLRLPNPFAGLGKISESWMPFATGLLFFLPFLGAVWLLEQIPQPSAADELARVKRAPMDGLHRWAFLLHFLPGMLMLLIAYFFLTAYRGFRDDFGAEIFNGLHYEKAPDIFSRSEAWVMLGVAGALAGLFFIRNNRWGLIGAFAIMVVGTLLIGGGTLLYDAGMIDGLKFMIITGTGSYLAYVPYGSVLFDRLIASTGVVATAVFAIYVADFVGYSGQIITTVAKYSIFRHMSHLDFYRNLSYFLSILGFVMLIASCVYFVYFHRHGRRADEVDREDREELPAAV